MRKKANNIIFGLLMFGLIELTSCSDGSIVKEETYPISNQSWSLTDTVDFDFDVDDTTNYFDFFLNIRTTTSYGYSNIYVFTTLESPTMVAVDTIPIPLADPSSGRWLGKVSGSMVENHVLFMKNVRFHELGNYKIRFVQGMRDAELAEISDVGLTIKKVVQ